MERNFKVEELEKKLRDICYFGKQENVKEVAEMGIEAIKLCRKQAQKLDLLALHMSGSKGYPMNCYDITEKEETFNYDENLAIRKIYTYSMNGEEIAKIYEQNWFAGYGIKSPKGGWVGLLDK